VCDQDIGFDYGWLASDVRLVRLDLLPKVSGNTFESAHMFDAVLCTVHVRAIGRPEVGCVEAFKIFPTLERCRRICRITHVATDG
jgi:hypothetical protein